jgi:hypothetical protein
MMSSGLAEGQPLLPLNPIGRRLVLVFDPLQ